VTDDFEQRLQQWLAELPGVTEPRRLVRQDETRALVSKFEPGFAAHLHDVLDRVPELFDRVCVESAYRAFGQEHPEVLRAMAWRVAIDRVLTGLAVERELSEDDIRNVRGGLDSVAALIDSVLWTSPVAGDASYAPSAGELQAYEDAAGRMEDNAPVFTRAYGVFEGVSVVNYCPAAPFGRVLFQQAWAICAQATE
jgi:hypothetical protein